MKKMFAALSSIGLLTVTACEAPVPDEGKESEETKSSAIDDDGEDLDIDLTHHEIINELTWDPSLAIEIICVEDHAFLYVYASRGSRHGGPSTERFEEFDEHCIEDDDD